MKMLHYHLLTDTLHNLPQEAQDLIRKAQAAQPDCLAQIYLHGYEIEIWEGETEVAERNNSWDRISIYTTQPLPATFGPYEPLGTVAFPYKHRYSFPL